MKKGLVFLLFFISWLHAGEWANKVLASLSLEEKIGQLLMIDVRPYVEEEKEVLEKWFQVDVHAPDRDDYLDWVSEMISKYHIGGLLLMKGKAVEYPELVNRFQKESNLPLLVAIDAEWGIAMRLKDIEPFPYQMTLGALPDKYESLIGQMGGLIGEQCCQLGAHINFAPVVDVNSNPKNPIINHRSFGQDKERVASKGLAYMNGLQQVGVIAVAKHFPGHGDVSFDTHLGLCNLSCSLEQLKDTELYPFKRLIDNGVEGVMTAHLIVESIDGEKPATLSEDIISKLLRNELGFNRLIFADVMMMKAIVDRYGAGEAALLALKAGVDINVMPADVAEVVEFMKTEITYDAFMRCGDLLELLDNAVLKVLNAKEVLGLHEEVIVGAEVDVEEMNKKVSAFNKEVFSHVITSVGSFKPLQEGENVIYVHVGDSTDYLDGFFKYLEERLRVEVIHLSWKSDELERLSVLENCVDKKVVIGLHDMGQHPKNNFGITDEFVSFLDDLNKQGGSYTLAVFGNPYSLQYVQGAPSILVAYQDLSFAYEAVADVLVGRQEPEGILPVFCY